MPFEIETGPKAINELIGILNWYAEQQEDLPRMFRVQYEKDVSTILQNPEIYPQFRRGYRQALMQTFPYFIIYSINKKEGNIFIISIFHTSRHPRKKFSK